MEPRNNVAQEFLAGVRNADLDPDPGSIVEDEPKRTAAKRLTPLVFDVREPLRVLTGQREPGCLVENPELTRRPEPEVFHAVLVRGLGIDLIKEVEGVGNALWVDLLVSSESMTKVALEFREEASTAALCGS
jgi:hypothetical protein